MYSQLESPLFSTIPPELRNRIFALALTPHTDRVIPFKRNAYYYRPNFRYYDNTYLTVALLRTCKRIHEETKHLPVETYVHVAWFYRGPPRFPHYDYLPYSREPSLCELSVYSEDMPDEEGVYPVQRLEEAEDPSYDPDAEEPDDYLDEDDMMGGSANEHHSGRASPSPSDQSDSTDLSYFSGSVPETLPPGPPNFSRMGLPQPGMPRPYSYDLRHLHVFTQQFWLYGWGSADQQTWVDSTSWDPQSPYAVKKYYSMDGLRENAPHLKTLKITLRHSDWYWWERGEKLMLDAKQAGNPLLPVRGKNDEFDKRSWGSAIFRRLPYFLESFELELETVEGKKSELDAIVQRACDWQLPLTDGTTHEQRALVARRVTRKGWWGERLQDIRPGHWEGDPVEARKRLEADGVDFTVEDCQEEIVTEDRMTYYVVTIKYVPSSRLHDT